MSLYGHYLKRKHIYRYIDRDIYYYSAHICIYRMQNITEMHSSATSIQVITTTKLFDDKLNIVPLKIPYAIHSVDVDGGVGVIGIMNGMSLLSV